MTTSSGPKKDFFISYNKNDRLWAEWIAWELEEAGYSTVLQAWDFRPGGNFVLEMDRATREANRTIAVLSPSYLHSIFTQPEWAAAFAQDPTGAQCKLLPVRVSECDVAGLLLQIIYIDLVRLDEASARRALLNGVKAGRAKPSVAPVFPGSGAHAGTPPPTFPGSLPAIWHVPHARNPRFTGRGELLDELRKRLTSGNSGMVAQEVLHGLGGIGKTQTVVEYVHRWADDYSLVWWLHAEEQSSLLSGFSDLAKQMSLPLPEDAKADEVRDAVRHALSSRAGWLLVFDHAPDPASIHSWVPQAAGHVLVTSRNPNWGGAGGALQVDRMGRSESVELLLRRTGQTDAVGANDLAADLGDLPLALAQAAAYMEETVRSLAEYHRLWQSKRAELARRGRASLDYPDTVATTWLVSFARLATESPASLNLLIMCSFMAPNDIPLAFFATRGDMSKVSPSSEDLLQVKDVFSCLRRNSLAELTYDGVSVHTLVQAVMRDLLLEDERKERLRDTLAFLDQAFPGSLEDPATWDASSRLLPHVLIAAHHSEEDRHGLDIAAHLLHKAGLYLMARADLSEARTVLLRALAAAEESLGKEHHNVALVLADLGSLERDCSNLDKAQHYLRKAVRMTKRLCADDHSQLVRPLTRLGTVYQKQGRLATAEACLAKALRICESISPADTSLLAAALNNLGGLCCDMGRWHEAAALFEQALAIDEATRHPGDIKVADRLCNMGAALAQGKNLDDALRYSCRALRIYIRSYGKAHPTVAMVLNNIGAAYLKQNILPAAATIFRRALKINEDAYGLTHPEVARICSNLGYVASNQGDQVLAESFFQRALDIYVRLYGPSHDLAKQARANVDALIKWRAHNASNLAT